MDVSSQHLFADVWLDQELDNTLVEQILAVVERRLTVVERYRYDFEPQGTTIVFILAESHFAMHVYPERNYFSLDIYVCNRDVDLEDILDEMLAELKVSHVDRNNIERGNTPAQNKTYIPREGLRSVYFMTFLVAACSILYELLMAQSLSAIMGNSVLRYNLTIGIYIASMGVGALLFHRFKNNNQYYGLTMVEMALCLIGGLSPVAIVIFDAFFQWLSKEGILSYQGSFAQFSISLFNYGLIFLVGFLSGLELPYLMNMASKRSNLAEKRVLVTDYMGTLVGAMLFPLAIFPYMRLFNIGYFVALINCMVAIYLALKLDKKYIKTKIAIGLVFSFYLFLVINSEEINQMIISKFYLGN